MIGINDGLSFVSENSNAISLQFEFDSIILGSTVYQAAHRSHLKQVVRADQTAGYESTTHRNTAGLNVSTHRSSVPWFARSRSSMGIPDTVPIESVSASSSTTTNSTQRTRSKLRASTTLLSLRNATRLYRDQFRSSQKTERPLSAQEIDSRIDAELGNAPKRYRVLLLGPGIAGKTTILNAIKSVHGNSTIEEKLHWVGAIKSHILVMMKSIILAMPDLNLHFDSEALDAHAATLVAASDDEELPSPSKHLKITNAIIQLWSDDVFRAAYRLMPDLTTEWDNLPFFVREVHRLFQPGYIPTWEDILRTRVRTTGIIETNFRLGDIELNITDVGGCRSERKKWIHIIHDASAFIFVADTSGYAKCLIEDRNGNGSNEQFVLFDALVNSRYFEQSTLILALTKIDRLEEVLEMKPPSTDFFPPTSILCKESFLDHLEASFIKLIESDERRKSLRIVRADMIGPGRQRSVQDLIGIILAEEMRRQNAAE
jgi:GTPase SAR1 family protein